MNTPTTIRTRIARFGAIAILGTVAAIGIAGPASADSNGDGDVDGNDFLRWNAGHTVSPAGDLADWQANYGATTAASGDYDVWQANFGIAR